ncbi:alpha/beta hydrolase [Jannaschia ovalis]|uniref:Prolyl oligopeptidase family serine peptidase n=1 Tax=Jannaschia ovalis TaxID=3038773 RepID=A0ABY8LGL1_9RHOB|nr:prolyl oligopeptidase family serine peptidase [Jannaschia sp. GRR-S6-38]WGH80406.1 prolyl oligopeptidase family serine peptidase [Jannaschia sp. GRR-S6-38]
MRHERRGPEAPKRLVVFLHGYGANAADLIGLADPLMPHLPDTAFLSPDAPEALPGLPGGFQWFPIPWIDGSSEEAAEQGMDRAVADLTAWLDEVMAAEGVSQAETVLFGFSQGTMMALHVGPRSTPGYAGLVCFSGRLLKPEELTEEAATKPPVLLVHGDQDEVVPVQSLPHAAEALEAAGFEQVYAHVMKGTGHGIAPDGLQVALAFLRDVFGIET